ncbi:methyltransferase [Candidatus Woesearchaeota archaeon]|nr:methyltransferase [Candidatus Woesearchaeota archaeon]
MTKQPHYYSEKQSAPMRLRRISAVLRGRELELETAGGTFSPKKIDSGSRILIESAEIRPGWRVLDLGCGYGPVGLAVAKDCPECEIVMTDVNRRAFQLAKRNVELNSTANATVVRGDMYENVRGSFNTILLNPPVNAGRKLCFEMIEKAKGHLDKGGLLQLVARHQKGGKMLEKKMEEVFGNVRQAAKKGGFRVYVSEKR